MTLSLPIEIAEPGWMDALPDIEALAQRAVAAALARFPMGEAVEIGLTFADDDFVRQLNLQYRGKDKPTNVLSFPVGRVNIPLPLGERIISLGDIVLALQTVATESRQENKALAAHTQHLIVHGVLHLLGHDHENESDAEAMEAVEIEILDAIGVANPYTVLLNV